MKPADILNAELMGHEDSMYALFDHLRETRDPKLHLAFGYGSHMCLGQHLATMEVARFLQELLPRFFWQGLVRLTAVSAVLYAVPNGLSFPQLIMCRQPVVAS